MSFIRHHKARLPELSSSPYQLQRFLRENHAINVSASTSKSVICNRELDLFDRLMHGRENGCLRTITVKNKVPHCDQCKYILATSDVE